MSCLLPQFKCSPDTFSVKKFHLKSGIHTANDRHPLYFWTRCVLSTASPPPSTETTVVLNMDKSELLSLDLSPDSIAADGSWKPLTPAVTTAVLGMEKLKLPSFEDYSNSVASDGLWTYTTAGGPPTEATKSIFHAEALLASEEAVIAAAAAEAVTLAKAALKVAKEVALLVRSSNSSRSADKHVGAADTTVFNRSEVVQPGEKRGDLKENGLRWSESDIYDYNTMKSKPTHEELELCQVQFSNSITVKSNRQKERKSRRDKAAERAAANIMSVKSESTSRKKRAPVKAIDYSDPLRYFRGSTNSCKLLTSAEEQLLSEGIQDLLKLERQEEELREQCGGQPTFAQWAIAAGVDQKTLRKRLNYGIQCKDKMISSNIKLVISIAKKYQGAGLSIQDLVQEGCQGLVKGAEKFDASKGFRFSTYAYWWIKQAVRKCLSEQSRTIRLPINMVAAAYKVKEARKQLYTVNGRDPDDKEVAEATGMSMKRLNAVMLTAKAPRSLDQKVGINLDLKPSEVIADPEAETTEELLMKQFMRRDLEKVLDTLLNPREKQVLRWRFGLEDGRMKPLQEIGELMNVSRERIRQIESRAFRKLKSKKETEHLLNYLTA
ncbi:unnamed protein product [Cuscuta epithymum]|uniref:RNA polymerase sigma factor n=1 Tax=Cuscuta epithymum TaxID=186058 RepID=A0AAV0DRJ4_9ASTE|nr:unnamed protein product [Cuscuta epithymum]